MPSICALFKNASWSDAPSIAPPFRGGRTAAATQQRLREKLTAPSNGANALQRTKPQQ